MRHGQRYSERFYPEDEDKIYTCRSYYRLTFGGTQRYSLLFGNTVDSTFADGSRSRVNQVIGSWKIHACRVGLTAEADMNEAKEPRTFYDVTFAGNRQKTVLPGEQFHTDPVLLSAKAGEYLCVEMCFSGKELPCHPESWLPGFLKMDGGWEYTTKIPFASMVGYDRRVKKRLIFLGDSITQGIALRKIPTCTWPRS